MSTEYTKLDNGTTAVQGALTILKVDGPNVTIEWRIGDHSRTFTLRTGGVFRVLANDNWFLSKIELERMYKEQEWQQSPSSDSQEKQESEKTPQQDS